MALKLRNNRHGNGNATATAVNGIDHTADSIPPGQPVPFVPPWARLVDDFTAAYPPTSDNIDEYIAAVAIRFAIPEIELSNYIRSRIRKGQLIARATMERAMYVKAQEAAALVGVRIAKAFAVIDDGMNAERVTYDREGNAHFTPDHRTRITAAAKLLDTLGANHPSKAIVEHEIGDKLAALSTDELRLRLVELVQQAGGTLRASGVKGIIDVSPPVSD